MALFLSILPLGLLIFLMVSPWPAGRLPMPATRALPLMALLAYGLQIGYFRAGYKAGELSSSGPTVPDFIHAAVVDGLLSALTPLAIVLGALVLFKTLEHSGAMAVLTHRIRCLTPDSVAQCLLLGWSFSYLVEGLSGFGTPAALAAPVLANLLGRRYSVLRVAALCLVMNSTPVSFGAVGTPTWFGLGNLGLTDQTLESISWKTAWIHALCAPVVAALALRIVLPWSEIVPRWRYGLAVLAATVIPSVLTARYSSEFPSIIGGLSGLLVGGVLAQWGWGLPRTESGSAEPEVAPAVTASGMGWFRAAFPILAVIVLLAVTRIQPLGLKGLLNLDTPQWVFAIPLLGEAWVSPALVIGLRDMLGTDIQWRMPLLYVPFLVPFVLVAWISVPVLGMGRSQVKLVWSESVGRLAGPAIALAGALVLVKLLMLGNLMSPAMILGQSLGQVTGQGWPWFAALLGALGSFFSGSNTVSNLTFAPIQLAIAEGQRLPVDQILALQSVGGALGNMVCIHNMVAVAAILGLKESPRPKGSADPTPDGAETETGGIAGILRLTFPPMVVYAVLAALAGALVQALG